MKILKSIIAFLNGGQDVPPDPRKHCTLLRDEGCAHVDGYLCDTRTCNEKRAYDRVILKGKLKLIVNNDLN